MYKTIVDDASDNIIIKKSNFIASAFHVDSEDEARAKLEAVCKEHYKATHNCYAYRVNGQYLAEKSSDNGEPSGTAGMPILDTLRGEGVENILVVVTRYFGGIKLGTGGLVRAYSSACKVALEAAEIVEISSYHPLTVKLDYSNVGKLDYYIAGESVVIDSVDYAENVIYKMIVDKDRVAKVMSDINELFNANVEMEKSDEVYGYLKDNKVIEV